MRPFAARLRESQAGSLTVAAIAALALSCGRERPPDILLISLDTVRADAIESLGGAPPAMPALARFAEGGVRFRRAYTPIPFTLPAHMTLLTGLEPESHGVAPNRPLDGSVATLAERLRGRGYSTIGLHSSEWVKGEFGFARGFDRYEQIDHDLKYADRLCAAALDAVDWESRDRPPVFVFLHFMDAHSDFTHIGGNRLPYYADEADRRSLGELRVEQDLCMPDGRCASDFLVAAERGEVQLDARRVGLLRGLYAAGLSELDRALERLFSALARSGALERSVVVVTADHGEEFFEHGRFLHSQVYDETSRVPLVVSLPGDVGAGRGIEAVVGLADVVPTLLELVGSLSAGTAAELDGRSLLPALLGGALNERAYVLRDKLVPKRFGLVDGDLKLVLDTEGALTELYDLGDDRAEKRDLAKERSGDVRRMARELNRLRDTYLARAGRSSSDPSREVLTAEERARLRALGYLEAVP